MKNRFCIPLLAFSLSFSTIFAQTARQGVITGKIIDKNTQQPLVGAGVQIENSQTGTTTDTDGNFKLNVAVGSVNVKASIIGYVSITKYNVVVTSGNANTLTFELETELKTLDEVVIKTNRTTAAATTFETPNSIQRLSTEEIRSNPGGNFDISKVIQSLPGVGGTTSGGGFRNDIIIRGGAPNENVYYLDGVEIPVINHFSTQGSAGGPVGMLNVSFVEDVTLASSSFDARYDNALASVFQIKQRSGNREHFQSNIRLSASELALTTEGPLTKKTTFMASARRSYLQFLFKLIDLPIRPDYWDFQFKTTTKLNSKTTLTTLGIGAIDEFGFGVPKKSTPENIYVLRSVPIIEQWNYTVGVAVKRLIENGYVNVALSRNMFNNSLNRFEDQETKAESQRILGSNSQEIENKLRVDVNKFINGWKFAYGGSAQFIKYNNDFKSRIRNEIRAANGTIIQPAVRVQFNTAIEFFRFGAFAQVSKGFLDNKLNISGGIRSDMNTFMSNAMNPLPTLSPRVALAYSLNEKWTLNASIGRYFKLPIYTVLGYRDAIGQLVNKDNKYINSNHYVLGLEYLPKTTTRFTLEGFYKRYHNYPVSVRDGISLANQGGDFGAIGNERTTSTGKGQAYGFELLAQQKLVKNTFAVLSYTFVRSEFSGTNDKLLPSAWDNRHLISGLLGQKLKRNWELGLRYRYAGGGPYTPFDLVASQRNYLSLGTGILDNSQLNSQRLGSFNQLDFRIDKKWNYRRATLDLYLDLQNMLGFQNPSTPQYTFKQNETATGFVTTDGQAIKLDGSNATPLILPNTSGNVLPTIGFIVEFGSY
jgi:TonB dependent receptor/CarboxypepD_reg-like domain/TonB-dependent Receptor Plug Domain